MTLPRRSANGAMSERIQSARAEAMVQRRMAAGFTDTSRLSGNTTAASRTRSSPPRPPAPWISGILGAMAISSVSAKRQAEGGGGACEASSLDFPFSPGICFAAAGSAGALAGASGGRRFGSGTEAVRKARLAFGWFFASAGASHEPCKRARDLCAASMGSTCAPYISSNAAAAVINLSPQAKPPEAHFRPAFLALEFMAIPRPTLWRSDRMLGLMQDWPLLCHRIMEHAAAIHGTQEVVTRSVEGPIHRTNYAEIHKRALKVSQRLDRDGIKLGDRVATIAWNTWRHLESWYGIMGIGAICHTVNPRLFPDQIAWIINHAQDRVVMTDLTFVPILEKIADKLPSVERYVVFTDKAQLPQTTLKNAVAYED